MAHAIINHSLAYVEQLVCVPRTSNTIEGFGRSLSGPYGTHHHYSEKYMPLYIADLQQPGEEPFRETLETSPNSVAKKTIIVIVPMTLLCFFPCCLPKSK